MAKLYAFDFDGVICDSAVETAMSAWIAAQEIWPDLPKELPPQLLEQFREVRPVLETGYQAILILRLLFDGTAVNIIIDEFDARLTSLMAEHHLSQNDLKPLFGQIRDQWIEQDLSGWIAVNPLFNGVVDTLNRIGIDNSVIITTKQERFVKQILLANDIDYPETKIYGLERNMSKPDILAKLNIDSGFDDILFIEDRLPTLTMVISDSRLKHVQLMLAKWGYNSEQDKTLAKQNALIECISLPDLNRL